MKYNTICMSGGGICGFSFLSALNVLTMYNYININEINTFVGTSAGGILCFLLSIDYSPLELITYFKNFNFTKIDVGIDLNLFLNEYGCDDGMGWINTIGFLFEKKFNLQNINFIDLHILTKKKIYIIGSNFTKGIQETFSYETTPNMLILDALRISTSLPIIHTPVKYNDDYYIDGGITNNMAYELCDPNTTLCITFYDKTYFKLNNTFDLISGTIELLMKKKDKNLINYKKLLIKRHDNESLIECNTTIFNDTITCGHQSGLLFLQNELKLQIQNITIEINNKIISHVKITLNTIIDTIVNNNK